ncbi:MAG: hypothetical protein ACRC10_02160 [Thermoguttaceae bacterium]
MRLSALFVGLLCFSFTELSLNAQFFGGGGGHPTTSYAPYGLESSKMIGFPRPTMYHSPGYISPDPGYVVQYGQRPTRLHNQRRLGRQRMNVPSNQVIVPENNNHLAPIAVPDTTESGKEKPTTTTKPVPVVPGKPVRPTKPALTVPDVENRSVHPVPPPVDKPVWNENDSSVIETPQGSIVPKPNVSKPTTPEKSDEATKSRPTEVNVPSTKKTNELIPTPAVQGTPANRELPLVPDVVIPKTSEKPIENPASFLDSPAVQNAIFEEESQNDQPFGFDSVPDDQTGEPIGNVDQPIEQDNVDVFRATEKMIPAEDATQESLYQSSEALGRTLEEQNQQNYDSLEEEGPDPFGADNTDKGSSDKGLKPNQSGDDFDFGVFDNETPDSKDNTDSADDLFDFGDVETSTTPDDDFDFGDLGAETGTDTTDLKSEDDFDFELDSAKTPVVPTNVAPTQPVEKSKNDVKKENGEKPIPAAQPADEEEDPFG